MKKTPKTALLRDTSIEDLTSMLKDINFKKKHDDCEFTNYTIYNFECAYRSKSNTVHAIFIQLEIIITDDGDHSFSVWFNSGNRSKPHILIDDADMSTFRSFVYRLEKEFMYLDPVHFATGDFNTDTKEIEILTNTGNWFHKARIFIDSSKKEYYIYHNPVTYRSNDVLWISPIKKDGKLYINGSLEIELSKNEIYECAFNSKKNKHLYALAINTHDKPKKTKRRKEDEGKSGAIEPTK